MDTADQLTDSLDGHVHLDCGVVLQAILIAADWHPAREVTETTAGAVP